MRLAALARRHPGALTAEEVEGALVAHLCRCTGWRTIVDAALSVGSSCGSGERDPAAAARRAALEGGALQRVAADVVLGEGGFADDTAPPGALVAVPDGVGGWAVGGSLSAARKRAGKVQGRRTTAALGWPLEVAPGDWDLTLRTTWVEPAYLEPDASWCEPGGTPASPLANGGAFGGKVGTTVPAAARELADRHGRAVRVVLAREDVVRVGPKRPPVAVGVLTDGTGVLRVVRTPGIARAVAAVAPGLVVEELDVAGPPTSAAIRAAGWAEAAIVLAAARALRLGAVPVTVVSPAGGWATAGIAADGAIGVRVGAGPVLDAVVLRSYCVGAAHQALGWVTSEGIAVDADGVPQDLTIRSFGILQARDMPAVTVSLASPGEGAPGQAVPAPVEPVNGSDAVFAAVAAAAWITRGLPPAWPTDRPRST